MSSDTTDISPNPFRTFGFNDGVEAAAKFFLDHVAYKNLSTGEFGVYPAAQAPNGKRLCMARAIRALKKETA